jgi:catechol 2,3-dioxygenase-like lactoylglutathione lyase family enzyme
MFSHTFTGVKNFERAFSFYSAIAAELGLVLRFKESTEYWAGWQLPEGGRPLFVIGRPFDGNEHEAGNGQMIAFFAKDRDTVRRVYERALSSGGESEGEPGLRKHYHPNYFGAYFRDTEGNKVCIACHAPESSAA